MQAIEPTSGNASRQIRRATQPASWHRELIRRKRRQIQRLYKTSLWDYVRHTRPLVALTAPLIYLCVIPFLLLDLFISAYQFFCFPIYGIPKVRRGAHLVMDRGLLPYLNALERVHCAYCSYVNGLISYVREIVARTEQHWCPIRHSRPAGRPHSRYKKFLPFGDAQAYRKHVQAVRGDFSDLPYAPGRAAVRPGNEVLREYFH